MRQRRIFTLVSMDELEADVRLHVLAISTRWIYFEPHFVFEPRQAPPFLPKRSNIKSMAPKE